MSPIHSLNDLFADELQILLGGEEKRLLALPKLATAATAVELRESLERLLGQARRHAETLRGILGKLGLPAVARPCPAMAGLMLAAEERAVLQAPGVVRDAALIVSGQEVEHYGIAGYGAVRDFAALLGHGDFADVLEEIGDDEAEAGRALTALAVTLNGRALVEAV